MIDQGWNARQHIHCSTVAAVPGLSRVCQGWAGNRKEWEAHPRKSTKSANRWRCLRICLSWLSRSPLLLPPVPRVPSSFFWLLLSNVPYLDRTSVEKVTVPDGGFLDGSMHATLFLNGPFPSLMLRPTTTPPAFQLCRPLNGRPSFVGD